MTSLFFLSLPLFLPFSHFTHLSPDRLLLNRNGVSSSTVTAASSLSKRCSKTPSLQTVYPSGVASGHQPTCLPKSICLESTTPERAPVAEDNQTAMETQEKKTTETETRSTLPTAYAYTVSRWSIPGKIWMPTNQIRVLSLAHTYPANYLRVHFWHLGVYKESRVAHRAIRVRVS